MMLAIRPHHVTSPFFFFLSLTGHVVYQLGIHISLAAYAFRIFFLPSMFHM